MGPIPESTVERQTLFTSEHPVPAANILARAALTKGLRRKSLSFESDGSTIAIFLKMSAPPIAMKARRAE